MQRLRHKSVANEKNPEANIKQTARPSVVGALRKLKCDRDRFVHSCSYNTNKSHSSKVARLRSTLEIAMIQKEYAKQ